MHSWRRSLAQTLPKSLTFGVFEFKHSMHLPCILYAFAQADPLSPVPGSTKKQHSFLFTLRGLIQETVQNTPQNARKNTRELQTYCLGFWTFNHQPCLFKEPEKHRGFRPLWGWFNSWIWTLVGVIDSLDLMIKVISLQEGMGWEVAVGF